MFLAAHHISPTVSPAFRYDLICNAPYYPLSEKRVSADARDLIDGLLEKNPGQRLGTFREKDILEHPWFADLDVKAFRKRKVRAPWVPAPIKFEE